MGELSKVLAEVAHSWGIAEETRKENTEGIIIPVDSHGRRPRKPTCKWGHLRTADSHGASGQCRQCAVTQERKRRPHLKKLYGISPPEYDAMLAAQSGRCAVCGMAAGDAPRGVLYVDHDHSTGRVRALLCSGCNGALGQAREDPKTLRALADYMERHR